MNADLASLASIVDVDVEEEEEGAGDTRLLAEFIEKTGVPGRDLLSSRAPEEGDGEVANENASGWVENGWVFVNFGDDEEVTVWCRLPMEFILRILGTGCDGDDDIIGVADWESLRVFGGGWNGLADDSDGLKKGWRKKGEATEDAEVLSCFSWENCHFGLEGSVENCHLGLESELKVHFCLGKCGFCGALSLNIPKGWGLFKGRPGVTESMLNMNWVFCIEVILPKKALAGGGVDAREISEWIEDEEEPELVEYDEHVEEDDDEFLMWDFRER